MQNRLRLLSVMLAGLFIIIGCDQKAATNTEADKKPATPAAADDALAEETGQTETMKVDIPLGLPELDIPEDNPMTEAKVELGKMLYFDKRMSKDATISCATCHDPKMAWAEHRPTSEGIGNQVGGRNSPTVINAAYMPVQFWDGRAASLEEQALGPIENPIEMGHTMADLVPQIEQIPEYKKRFEEVFGTGVTNDGIAKAIAAFERTVLSGNSPYDKYMAGDKLVLTEQQVRGMKLFNSRGECATCHTEPIFSNGKYYNAGVGSDKPEPDIGRKEVTGQDYDMGKFRVPHLREVANTAPYFHDGSVEKLEDAVRLMATGGIDNPNLSGTFRGLKEAKITDEEIADITAFLTALSGEYPVIEPPELP